MLLACCLVAALTCRAQQVVVVKKNDAQSLLDAVAQANKVNADKQAETCYILIPDGVYDLGEAVLTKITGHHIALIGQSMRGTVIQNKPDVKGGHLEDGHLTEPRHGQLLSGPDAEERPGLLRCRCCRQGRHTAGQGRPDGVQPRMPAVVSGHLLLGQRPVAVLLPGLRDSRHGGLHLRRRRRMV